jgi:hypothetical protein
MIVARRWAYEWSPAGAIIGTVLPLGASPASSVAAGHKDEEENHGPDSMAAHD